MGREIKRVPLDFDWQMNKIWKGFINPYYKKCPEIVKNKCFGGVTAAYQWLDGITRFMSIIGSEAYSGQFPIREGRLYPHPYLKECNFSPVERMPDSVFEDIEDDDQRWAAANKWHRQHPPKILPLDTEVLELIEGIAGEKIDGMYDGQYKIMTALLKLSGVNEDTWGQCPVCKGSGIDPAFEKLHEEWEPEEPPKGNGWQLWETVSEGSPISPVFATKEEFVGYLVGQGYSKESAEAFAEDGYCSSALIVDGKMYENIESCGVK